MQNNETSTLPANPRALLRSTEAVTNWRALVMTVLGAVAVFLCVSLTGWMSMRVPMLGMVFGLVSLAVMLVAYSAVGILLMRQAQQRPVTMADALLQAVFTVHRLLGVGLLLVLIFIGIVLASLLVLFLCRIPGLGALLYALAYPVLALVLGVSIVGLGLVAFPLAAPAVWEGNTVFQTIARLLAIMRSRLLNVIVSMLVLVLLLAVLSGVVGGVLASGNMAAIALSSAAGVEVFGGVSGVLQSLAMVAMAGQQGSGWQPDGASYLYAFSFGSGLLFTIGAIVPVLTAINGNCLIYLEASSGLDFSEAEGKLRSGVDEARRRAQEVRERAATKPVQPEGKVAEHSVGQPEAAAGPARACSGCHAPLGPEDRFCGECGTDNRQVAAPGLGT